jgi:two-component system nitrogen regulation sensor histidine kinase NtrY
MTAPPPFRRRKLGLQFKLTIATLVMVLAPLGVSAYLISGIGKVTQNFNQNEERAHGVIQNESNRIYTELVETTKLLHAEIAQRLAKRPELLDPSANLEPLLKDPRLPGLRAIATLRADGSVIAQAERPPSGQLWQDRVVDTPLDASGAVARLTFEVLQPGAELKRLEDALDLQKPAAQVRSDLPGGYQAAFLVLMTLAAVAAAGFGVLASTFVTRRIATLVTAARAVSDGRLDTRVELRGGDEMAELGGAFNTMLDDLAQTRTQVEYLQRISAWQDVARRLAHEIKNPLTPIQLAVQQCVSAYKGPETDPARFGKLLRETGEIVEEEIEGLRRLVDTFRTLGQLPKVEKAPLALADVIEELKLDPAISDRLVVRPPLRSVTVRADKLLLKRVLANLVENGIHAAQEAGAKPEVVVSWSSDASTDTVSITVDDRGPGVPAEERERIFEPYMTTKATGTGLGLAIARKIAIEHGGDLAIAPGNAPTGGARFVVSLPLRGPDTSL